MEGYKRCWEITEELKAQDQMKWVQLINLAKAEAEANIIREIVFELIDRAWSQCIIIDIHTLFIYMWELPVAGISLFSKVDIDTLEHVTSFTMKNTWVKQKFYSLCQLYCALFRCSCKISASGS